jgi:hypothetical protein
MNEPQNLFDLSPAAAIDRGAIVGYDVAFTLGARIVGIDRDCMADEDLEGRSRY